MKLSRMIPVLKWYFERAKLALYNTSGEGSFSFGKAKADKGEQHVTKIGGTTYLVSSFFNGKAQGTVVDKVARLIGKETSYTAKK